MEIRAHAEKDVPDMVRIWNEVVENNIHARHLYERLGFVEIGTVPRGFRMKDGTYQNIVLYYHTL